MSMIDRVATVECNILTPLDKSGYLERRIYDPYIYDMYIEALTWKVNAL